MEEIKAKRQNQFIKNRLKAGLKLREDSDKREVEKSIHLLEEPVDPEKIKEAQLQRQKGKVKAKAVEMETN